MVVSDPFLRMLQATSTSNLKIPCGKLKSRCKFQEEAQGKQSASDILCTVYTCYIYFSFLSLLFRG